METVDGGQSEEVPRTVNRRSGSQQVSSQQLHEAIEHFHECVLDGAEPIATAAHAAGTLRIIEEALTRTRSG